MPARPSRRLASPFRPHSDQLLIDVLEAARHFLALQERAAEQSAGQAAAPRSLAEAIDRDFLLFDLHDAARDLRDAVQAADDAAGLPATRLSAAAEARSAAC